MAVEMTEEEFADRLNKLGYLATINSYLLEGTGISSGALTSGAGTILSAASTLTKVTSSNDPVANLDEYLKFTFGLGVPTIGSALIAAQAEPTPIAEAVIGTALVVYTGAAIYQIESFERQDAPLLDEAIDGSRSATFLSADGQTQVVYESDLDQSGLGYYYNITNAAGFSW